MTIASSKPSRIVCNIDGYLRFGIEALLVPCKVENISAHGVKLRVDEALNLPRRFHLAYAHTAATQEERFVELKWRVGSAAGVFFAKLQPAGEIETS